MSKRTLDLDDQLYTYLLDVSLRETDILKALREETTQHPGHQMQIAPEQGQFMAWLVRALGVTRAIELGTFTGYSALWIALALPPEGRLITCDLSEAETAIARRYWEKAGVADRIDLRLGPALATLDQLLADGQAGSFDFVFIDADKRNYSNYFERTLELLRPRGVMAIDNVLWSGAVADPTVTDPQTAAIRALNERLHQDDRIHLSLVPIADGLTLIHKN